MAQRRMFSMKIIDTDHFLDMGATAQLLYFHLSMRADDDGFVSSPKKIMKIVNCSDDDLKLLVGKQFIIPFENGICVIKDWRIHNYIQKDRYQKTRYVEEKKQLEISENGSYIKCIQDGYILDTQVRLDKVRLGEISLGEVRLDKDNTEEIIEEIKKEWNKLSLNQILNVIKGTERYEKVINIIRNIPKDLIINAIRSIENSSYLMGKKTGQKIKFDWFIDGSNLYKILEGEYEDKESSLKGTQFNNFESRKNSDRYEYLQEQCLLNQATEDEEKAFNEMRKKSPGDMRRNEKCLN